MFIPHLNNMANTLAAGTTPPVPAPAAATAKVAPVADVTQEGARASVDRPLHGAAPAHAPGAAAAEAAPASGAPERAAPLDDQQLQALAEQVQERLQGKASNLLFSLDKDSGETVVKVVDRQTQEVIKQIPSEEMVALAQALQDMQEALDISGVLEPGALDAGMLVKQQV